jgi:hypothetical protein
VASVGENCSVLYSGGSRCGESAIFELWNENGGHVHRRIGGCSLKTDRVADRRGVCLGIGRPHQEAFGFGVLPGSTQAGPFSETARDTFGRPHSWPCYFRCPVMPITAEILDKYEDSFPAMIRYYYW